MVRRTEEGDLHMKNYEAMIDRARARADGLIGERALAQDKLAKARRAALGVAFERFVKTLAEDEQARLFGRLEAHAMPKDAKLIASHPLRPAVAAAVA
jgi:hypothetical protein